MASLLGLKYRTFEGVFVDLCFVFKSQMFVYITSKGLLIQFDNTGGFFPAKIFAIFLK